MKKKHKNLKIAIGFLLLTYSNMINAQESINAGGGNISNYSGNISYSVGQVFYTKINGISGTIIEGVQQPYFVYSSLGVSSNSNINLIMSVYPNPTSDFITLKIQNEGIYNMEFQLFDLSGRLIIRKSIYESETKIQMESLAGSLYFLKILKNDKPIKNFKIIKQKLL